MTKKKSKTEETEKTEEPLAAKKAESAKEASTTEEAEGAQTEIPEQKGEQAEKAAPDPSDISAQILADPKAAIKANKNMIVENKSAIQHLMHDFHLSRVFALLSLIIGIGAVGLISALFIHIDGRTETLETSYKASIFAIGEKLETLDKKTDPAPEPEKDTSPPPPTAKEVLLGGELSKTLYLLKSVAGDSEFSEEIRERASQAHAHVDAMLNDLESGK